MRVARWHIVRNQSIYPLLSPNQIMKQNRTAHILVYTKYKVSCDSLIIFKSALTFHSVINIEWLRLLMCNG